MQKIRTDCEPKLSLQVLDEERRETEFLKMVKASKYLAMYCKLLKTAQAFVTERRWRDAIVSLLKAAITLLPVLWAEAEETSYSIMVTTSGHIKGGSSFEASADGAEAA